MLCKALKSFVSVESMKKGETRDINPALADALVKGGFVEALEDNNEAQPAEVVTMPATDADDSVNAEVVAEVVEPVKDVATSKPATAKRGRPSNKGKK